ncbi:MAG: VOC family protein [Candidatus Eisenbacteria bacterium]
MRIGHLELFVRDLPSSRDFYERVLGFTPVADQGAFLWLRCGDLEVLLRGEPGGSSPAPVESGRPESGGGSVEESVEQSAGAGSRPRGYGDHGPAIVLYTEDLPNTVRVLEARGLRFAGTDGSPSCPTFRDPDGHWFQLVDPETK